MTASPSRKSRIYRITLIGFLVNLLLTVVKLAAGIRGHSSAMVADAVHSASDFATDIVVLLFVGISARPQDEDHDYGHGKYETLAAILIGLALAAIGVQLFLGSLRAIRGVLNGAELPQPGSIALWTAALSIVCKEALYRVTLRAGRNLSSPTVVANAWHHRSDALSSIGTFVGIACARFFGRSWRIADPIAAAIVALLIVGIAWKLIRQGLDELLEKSLPAELESEILRIATSDPAVDSPHNLRTRRIGQRIAVDLHIRVDGKLSVAASHRLTVDIESRLRDRFGPATIINLHVEPRREPASGDDPRTATAASAFVSSASRTPDDTPQTE